MTTTIGANGPANSRKTLTALGAGALLVLAAASGASASTLPPFTFDPTAAGLTGASGPFEATSFNVSDYAIATLMPNGSGGANFVETGYLPVGQFQNDGAYVSPAGLNSTYGLYFQFRGTGTQSTVGLTPSTQGSFDSLDYTLYGYNGAPANFTPTSTTAVPAVTLATGHLIAGSVGVTPAPVTPTAAVTVSVTPENKAFFVSPQPFYTELFANFTNTQQQIGLTANGFTIQSGGGTADFIGSTPVPEPASLALLGAGLIGLGLVRSRSRFRAG